MTATPLKCAHCGANLTAPAGSSTIVCQYCGTTSTVAKQPLPQWQAPPGAGAPPGGFGGPPGYGPPQGMPPMMMPQPIMVVSPPKVSKTWIWFTLATVLVPLIGIIPVFFSTGVFSRGWDGEEPFSCGGNDHYEIEDVKASFGGTAMDINGNCKVEARDVDIKGKVAVKIGGNGRFTLHSGTIEGTHTAIDVGGNGRVVLHGGDVKGGKFAIVADINADVDTGGATIDGKIKSSMNAKIDGVRR